MNVDYYLYTALWLILSICVMFFVWCALQNAEEKAFSRGDYARATKFENYAEQVNRVSGLFMIATCAHLIASLISMFL